MKDSSLDARIRSVRKGVRSRQPLEHRVAKVLSYYAKQKAAEQKKARVQMIGLHQK